MSHWSMAEVRKTFKKVVDKAQREPQILENRGEPVAVILDFKTYRKLEKNIAKPLTGLWEKLDQIAHRSRRGLKFPEIRVNSPRDIFAKF